MRPYLTEACEKFHRCMMFISIDWKSWKSNLVKQIKPSSTVTMEVLCCGVDLLPWMMGKKTSDCNQFILSVSVWVGCSSSTPEGGSIIFNSHLSDTAHKKSIAALIQQLSAWWLYNIYRHSWCSITGVKVPPLSGSFPNFAQTKVNIQIQIYCSG